MADHLKVNAVDFLKNAEENLDKGRYNLAMFNLEQALRLSLKYTLYQLTGSYEKTHDIKRLLREVVMLTNNKDLEDILRREHVVIDLLEQAYIASRYLPYNYDKDTVEKAMQVVKGVLSVLGIV
ncbi:HEPN domain-containing protein [Stygiolobus caldivivus]|uniref:HEPN domain-containing protein n=1 Tax=Stygiolobus caldivivus TaxID=2824673 RepID=UPI001CED6D4A|nr:HEPN domain-containing protein [Stygiolobus caldivivus]